MSYIYILVPFALGVIFAACTGGYFLYINYQKNKLLKRLRQEMISARCGQVYTVKTSSMHISQEPEQFTGVYRERSPNLPYSLADNKLFDDRQRTRTAESDDTGFYSPHSQDRFERSDYRKTHHLATKSSILEFPTRGAGSAYQTGNDRLKRSHLSNQIRDYSSESWKGTNLQSSADRSSDAFAVSINGRRSRSHERKSALDSYASDQPPPLPPPRHLPNDSANQYLDHMGYPLDFADNAHSTVDRWTNDAGRNYDY